MITPKIKQLQIEMDKCHGDRKALKNKMSISEQIIDELISHCKPTKEEFDKIVSYPGFWLTGASLHSGRQSTGGGSA